ncbi:unnamed protein product [Sphagnum jensenii]|uniref:Aspartate/glutamate/uridylate kinase domain-containing protein n=1 Tax=Sphagnum jensenii TaxID=128206 RepID=A0ABP0ZYB1_9BRYO
MQVYKFGGASVKDAPSVKNVATILAANPSKDKVVVVSAMGKSTNELEKVVNLYIAGDQSWQTVLDDLHKKHLAIINDLFDGRGADAAEAVGKIIAKAKAFLLQDHSRNYNFVYDQIVSVGEYISTTIVSTYCNSQGIKNTLLDAKECIHTDNAYTEGKIDWKKTEKAINDIIPRLTQDGFVITQGFIGSTPEDFTTTLGREGSDYTAAIFSYALNAERMTRDTPKTIKPLQNKNIPLEVRSFIDHSKRGSIIAATANTSFLPPVIILKREQTLLSFSAKDFSFIAEDHLSKVFSVFAAHRLRINMMQNAAISFSICIDTKKEKLENILEELRNDFQIVVNENLTLLTIRHYNTGIIDRLTKDKDILLRQISRQTIQVLMRE